MRAVHQFALAGSLALLTVVPLSADVPIVNDTTTQYTRGKTTYPFSDCGSCDLGPSYNHYTVPSSFAVTRITFSWYDNGSNNCDGLGNYVAAISTTNNSSGIIATSTNGVGLGCAGLFGTSAGTSELDFALQNIPADFYLDFYSLNGLQDGANIVVYNIQIWQHGAIEVSTNLPSGTFSITGPATFSGSGTSTTIVTAPPGTYTATYGPVSGYLTPQSQTQTLFVGGTLSFTAVYLHPVLPVTLTGDLVLAPVAADIILDCQTNTACSGDVFHYYLLSGTSQVVLATGAAHMVSLVLQLTDLNPHPNPSCSAANDIGIYFNMIEDPFASTFPTYCITTNDLANSGAVAGQPSVISFPATGYIHSQNGAFDGFLGAGGTNVPEWKVFGFDAGFELHNYYDACAAQCAAIAINSQFVNPAGSIQITSNLSTATFRIQPPVPSAPTGGPYPVSIGNVPPGTYTVSFNPVVGYATPSVPAQTLTTGSTIAFNGQYEFTGPGFLTKSGTASEPINTATGDYYTSHADLVIPGKGLAFTFIRFYNSLDPYSGPLGVGWTHPFNVFLTVSGGAVTVKEADGHTAAFTPTGGGNYTAATPGVFDMLNQNVDGSFALTRKNQTRFNFSSGGRLMSIVDRNGNTQALSYDGLGNLTSILDSSGRTFTFASDANGRIISITDPRARSWQYAYDGNGNLVSVQDAAGGVTKYVYDASHRMISATDPRNVTYLQNAFDSVGRVTTQTNARGLTTTLAYGSPSPGTTTFTDPLGNATQHIYDGALRLVSVVNASGGTTTYTYDANNDRTGVTNQNGKKTSFTYDALGNTTSIVDPLGNNTKFTYDAKSNLLTGTNGKGNATTFTYDAKGNLTTIHDALGDATSFSYDPSGLLLSKTDARGNASAFAYDASGDLIRITDPAGDQTVLAYDGIGRLLTTTNPNGHTASASYDALGRLLKISDPLTDATQFSYDPVGNLLKLTDANGNATSYVYDPTNNLTMVTDALGNVTTYAYDANNNRAGFTNAKGKVTTYTFDALNRLSTITDPLSLVTSYAYDAVGNVTSTTDADGKINHFSYDALNRLTNISYADGKTVAYTYDADGNRTSMVDSHGITTYTYDALDRLTAVNNPGGKTVSYAYDPAGNRQSLQYPDGKSVSYSYDPANRLAGATDWLGRHTAYSYDSASNLISTAYPNAAGMSFSYDSANRLLQVQEVFQGGAGNPASQFTYALDAVGNRLQVTDGSGKVTAYGYNALYELTSVNDGKLTQYTYDPVGNRLSLTAPGTSTSYSYDADDRLLSAGSTTYNYDANGNRLTQKSGGNTQAFNYDAANRLISVAGGSGGNSSFAYDGDGNRLSQTLPAGAYQYVNDIATGLPVVLQEAGPDGNISYAYGLNRISESGTGFDYYYQYDGLGSAAGITDSSSKLQTRYVYDAWGNTTQTVPAPKVGTENKFQFTGEAVDPGTGLYYLRARYYDPAIGRLITRDSLAGRIRYPLSANKYSYALANPPRLVDPSGLTVAEIDSALNAAQSYQSGKAAMSDYQTELNCAYNTAGGCTVSDQAVNNTNQQQVQSLKDLQTAGSQAGASAYSGTTFSGSSNAFASAFDFVTSILDPAAIIQTLQDLTNKVIDLFTPLKAQAAALPPTK